MKVLRQLLCGLTAALTLDILNGVLAQKPDCGFNSSQGLWYQDTRCSKNFQVCSFAKWFSSYCVVGHFNTTTGTCQRFSRDSGCVNNDNQLYFPNSSLGRKKRRAERVKRRQKRQAADCPSLSTNGYWCPDSVQHVNVFPNWEDTGCRSFYVCLRGEMKLQSCGPDPYNYYNPTTLVCEEYPTGRSNTCLFRS